jgi:hypothetical protein
MKEGHLRGVVVESMKDAMQKRVTPGVTRRLTKLVVPILRGLEVELILM